MSVTIANPTPACARSSATARTAAACAAILALLQTAGDAQLGGAPPPIRQERKLVAEFDKNGNQRLDSVERKAAREWLAAQPPTGMQAFARAFSGFPAAAAPAPGRTLAPGDVSAYPGVPLYDGGTLRTI